MNKHAHSDDQANTESFIHISFDVSINGLVRLSIGYLISFIFQCNDEKKIEWN